MIKNITIKAPFFEIGPKNYLWGDDVVELANEYGTPLYLLDEKQIRTVRFTTEC